MRKKLRRIAWNSGETLVEVVASIFLFLIMMGVLTGAVSYSSSALEKNKEIRRRNNEILSQLADTEAAVTQTADIQFIATNSAMDTKGNPVFRVPVNLAVKTVTYKETEKSDAEEVIFRLYQPLDGTDAGGDGS